jgi:hypothetical protein
MKIDSANKSNTELTDLSVGEKVNKQDPSQKISRLADNSDAVCPITYEPISAFPCDDIYVTMTGIQYHKPSLKRWMQKYDTLPHNNSKALEEVHRFWPNIFQNKVDYLALRHDQGTLTYLCLLTTYGALAFLGLTIKFNSFVNIKNIGNDALRACRLEKDHIAHIQCFKSKVETLLTEDLKRQSNDIILRKISLGVTVCLAFSSFYYFGRYEKITKAIEEAYTKNLDRPMTTEEIEKADLGLEFYESKSA